MKWLAEFVFDLLYEPKRLLMLVAAFLIGFLAMYWLSGCGAVYREGKCEDAATHLKKLGCIGDESSEGPDWQRGTADDADWLKICEALQADVMFRYDTDCIVNAQSCAEADECGGETPD